MADMELQSLQICKYNSGQPLVVQPIEQKLALYVQDDIVDGYLDIKEVDPIFSTSYEMMIKEAFRADKNFILAKMKTRST